MHHASIRYYSLSHTQIRRLLTEGEEKKAQPIQIMIVKRTLLQSTIRTSYLAIEVRNILAKGEEHAQPIQIMIVKHTPLQCNHTFEKTRRLLAG